MIKVLVPTVCITIQFVLEILIIFSLTNVSSNVITSFKLRAVQFDHYSKQYKIYNVTYYGESDTIILQPETRLEIFCKSRSHIEWEAPLLTDVRLSIGSNKYWKDGVIVYESSLSALLDTSDTGVYQCISGGEKKLLYAFVKGNSSFVSKTGSDVDESFLNMILPCRVTDPSFKVQLFKHIRGKRTELIRPYDPKDGFKLMKADLPGEFTCKTNSEEIKYHRNTPDGFKDEILRVNCKNMDSTIAISDAFYEVKTSFDIKEYENITTLEYKGKLGDKGSISYYQNKEKLRTWDFLINEKPRFELVKRTGSVLCWSSGNVIKLKNLSCDSSNMCRIRRKCLDEPNSCPEFLYEGTACRPGNCSRLINSHNAGVLACDVDGAKITAEYFTGLNHLRYLDWNVAPKNALNRLDEVGSVIYNNPEKTPYFYCEATSFLFMDEIRFAFRYKNGSTLEVANENMKLDFTVANRIGQNIIGRGASINVTEDMQRIICLAPWRNITGEFYNTSRKFEVKNVQEPKIESPYKTIVFTEGDVNANVPCVTEGQPPPEVSWLRENRTIERPLETIKTENGLLLRFPKITQEFKGTYVCQAKNDLGTASVNFDINVVDGINWTVTHKVGLSIGIVFIFGIMFLAIVILWRKYTYISNHLRDLTDQEIEEFLKGNLDLLNSSNLTNEKALHSPYNQEYEIPYSDMSIDKTNVLGMGAFGIVYKCIHNSKAVAVKTTKSNAEVSYFKSLLSELKIIMYIGKHPNIIEYIGSCTENIKTRIVFIVFELSPLGNLQDYLRDEKSLISKSVHPDNTDKSKPIILTDLAQYNNCSRVTLTNMISWSIQIAGAMTFLENKKVIHGDMATRNVLLFPENVVKISDFGLSKQLYNYKQYIKGQNSPLPWRYLAIETLTNHTFSVKSDVWAYGITMWEIFSFGCVPYPNREWTEEFLQDLVLGMRLNCPRQCHKKIHDIMLECWSEEPNARPTFESIIEKLKAEVIFIRLSY